MRNGKVIAGAVTFLFKLKDLASGPGGRSVSPDRSLRIHRASGNITTAGLRGCSPYFWTSQTGSTERQILQKGTKWVAMGDTLMRPILEDTRWDFRN